MYTFLNYSYNYNEQQFLFDVFVSPKRGSKILQRITKESRKSIK